MPLILVLLFTKAAMDTSAAASKSNMNPESIFQYAQSNIALIFDRMCTRAKSFIIIIAWLYSVKKYGISNANHNNVANMAIVTVKTLLKNLLPLQCIMVLGKSIIIVSNIRGQADDLPSRKLGERR